MDRVLTRELSAIAVKFTCQSAQRLKDDPLAICWDNVGSSCAGIASSYGPTITQIITITRINSCPVLESFPRLIWQPNLQRVNNQ